MDGPGPAAAVKASVDEGMSSREPSSPPAPRLVHWARYQFCRIYFKICRRGAPAKILKKFAVGPDFHQDLSNLRCGVGGWVRLGLLGLEG